MPSGYKHGDTPKKAMVRGVISYLESQKLPVNKSAIFRHFELSRSQGYAALSLPASKRNDPEWEETRGRPSAIPQEEIKKMESLLFDERWEHLHINWTTLPREAGVEMECNPRTLHRAMGTLSYRRCLRCGQTWVHQRQREKRLEYARRMLEMYPQPQDWRSVRFSGELHFGFGLDGRMRLIPRSGEKICPPCDQQPEVSWPRDIKKVHVWGSVGFGFKSDLVFYEDSTSPNVSGNLSMPDYRDKVLEKVVKPWLKTAAGPQSFVLEEDLDSFAHGGASKVNMVQEWKDAAGLRCFFSCGDSPDLSPLDSLWPPQKQWNTASLNDWQDETLRQCVRETWAALDAERINLWVDSMLQRLRQVVESEGRMIPW